MATGSNDSFGRTRNVRRNPLEFPLQVDKSHFRHIPTLMTDAGKRVGNFANRIPNLQDRTALSQATRSSGRR